MNHGDQVTYSALLVRKAEYGNQRVRKYWSSIPCTGSGLFLGTRTLQNGHNDWEGNEVGYVFEPQEYFRAALISPGKNRNPIYVPLDSIQVINS